MILNLCTVTASARTLSWESRVTPVTEQSEVAERDRRQEADPRRRRGRQEDTASDNEEQCSVVRRCVEHGVLSRYGLVFTVTGTSLKIDALYIGQDPNTSVISTIYTVPSPAYCRYIGHTLILRKNHKLSAADIPGCQV